MKRILVLLLVVMLACTFSTAALAADYSDVPADSWAWESIHQADEYGLMNGVGGGIFGYGCTIKRAEFVTILVRMMGWTSVSGEDSATDISTSWARTYINTAEKNGVFDAGGCFRPEDNITRGEMAGMLIRALGLGTLAESDEGTKMPFTDVSTDRGYISLAYEIGMTTGVTATTFVPNGTATREQAAAMLVRIYEKYHMPTEFTHAFYAISSWSQVELAKQFDAVSVGWSHMTYDEKSGARLSTSGEDGSVWKIPSGYANALRELQGTSLKLCVFMSGSDLRAMLADKISCQQAIEDIMSELSRSYEGVGYNPYSGVTIDFEGLRATDKDNFNAFLSALSARVHTAGKSLYATVMPAVTADAYYDGYDFGAIAAVSDKVILMAHDYAPTNLTGFLNSTYYRNYPCAALSAVMDSVRLAVHDTDDISKLVLAVSMDSMAWRTDENGKLTAVEPVYPIYTTIYQRLRQAGSVRGWSDISRSPYLTYKTDDGQNIFLWYEDARSIREKLSCAKLFGISGTSVWRVGLIPAYEDEELHYNVMDALK